jgi:hypothetical protein
MKDTFYFLTVKVDCKEGHLAVSLAVLRGWGGWLREWNLDLKWPD